MKENSSTSKAFLRLIALLLAIMAVLPLVISCSKEEKDGEMTTTTVTTTTEAPKGAISPEVEQNKFAVAGLELMLTTIKDYYTSRTHWLKSTTTNNATGACAVWGVGAFIEALTETYKIFPENEKVKATYIDALTGLLDAYKVENATIVTPDKTRHTVTYYNASRGNAGDYYYDDNAWICIQLLEAYKLLNDSKYLEAAEKNLEFLWTGWDDVLDGGIYWDKTYAGKNTCSNGPTAIAFLSAYQITKKQEYFDHGKAIYDWANSKLLDGNLYIDSLSATKDDKNNWKAAYNQATMIYVGSQLFEITGESQYYTRTKDVVNATIDLMFNVVGTGEKASVSMKGNPIYKSWCIGWLARGFVKYYEIDEEKAPEPMIYLEKVLSNNMRTKNKKGYYDPYFRTGDWKSEDVNDILQPSGITSVFCIAGYYDELVKKDA